MDLDVAFIIKFVICLSIFVILPVWIFNMIDLSLVYKLGLTLAGGVGVFVALAGKSVRLHK